MFKRKKKSRVILLIILIFILLILVFSFLFEKRAIKINALEEKYLEIKKQKEYEKKLKEEREAIYNDCINSPYKDEEVDEMFTNLLNQLNSNNISIYFEDLNNNYSLTLNVDKSYYGASLIKLFVASYLVDNAREGNIDLNDKIVYTHNYSIVDTVELKNYKVNDEIPLSDLLKYSISVSDNAAHFMLFDYIGANNLKIYAKNKFNVNLTISDSNRYSYLTVSDTNALLNYVYELINVDDEYSELLVNAMNNTFCNGLNFDDITFLHKYGYYEQFYHDIGIYNSENPYLISIFTTYGNEDKSHISKLSEVSKKIYEIYEFNLSKKQNYCENLALNHK